MVRHQGSQPAKVVEILWGHLDPTDQNTSFPSHVLVCIFFGKDDEMLTQSWTADADAVTNVVMGPLRGGVK